MISKKLQRLCISGWSWEGHYWWHRRLGCWFTRFVYYCS